MIAVLDAAYRNNGATAACVLFENWSDSAPAGEIICETGEAAPYEPGKFYLRELPCLLAVLQRAGSLPGVIIVDGYVWLRDESDPGLGGHLYTALERKAAVIGVAKTRFRGASTARGIVRGASAAPLFITAAGIPLAEAADCIQRMHGRFRIPTLIRRADQLSRGLAPS